MLVVSANGAVGGKRKKEEKSEKVTITCHAIDVEGGDKNRNRAAEEKDFMSAETERGADGNAKEVGDEVAPGGRRRVRRRSAENVNAEEFT
ncbi:hypothetical protein MRX96_043727 [Rhipicephalus microplus]